MIWVGLLSVRSGTKASRYLKGIQLVVLAEFIIFLISIFRRVALYIQYHGWSLNRWYGSVLLIWLLGLVITLIGRHVASKPWARIDMAFTLALLVAIGFFKPESYITTHHPPTVNNRIDYLYLARMSADGYVGWQKAYEHTKQVLEDPKWLQQPVVDKEGRREIAYTGMILGKLHQNYVRLLEHYGTEQDFRRYADVVSDHETRVLQNQMNQVQITNTTLKPEEVTKRQNELQTLLSNVTKFKSELPNKKAEDLKDFYSWIYFTQDANPNFDQSNFYPSFYTVEPFDHQANYPLMWQPRSNWDKTLMWNGSEYKAYLEVLNYMPLEDLLTLEDKYFELNQKIRQQPATEKNFEWDTMPNSVFLEY